MCSRRRRGRRWRLLCSSPSPVGSHVLFCAYLSPLHTARLCSASSLPWGSDCWRPREDFRVVLEKGRLVVQAVVGNKPKYTGVHAHTSTAHAHLNTSSPFRYRYTFSCSFPQNEQQVPLNLQTSACTH